MPSAYAWTQIILSSNSDHLWVWRRMCYVMLAYWLVRFFNKLQRCKPKKKLDSRAGECKPSSNNFNLNWAKRTKLFKCLKVASLWILTPFLRCSISREWHSYVVLASFTTTPPSIFPPDVPSAPSAIALVLCTGSEMVLSWRAPAHTGGAPILGYYLDQKEEGAELWREVNVKAARERRFKVRLSYFLATEDVTLDISVPSVCVSAYYAGRGCIYYQNRSDISCRLDGEIKSISRSVSTNLKALKCFFWPCGDPVVALETQNHMPRMWVQLSNVSRPGELKWDQTSVTFMKMRCII